MPKTIDPVSFLSVSQGALALQEFLYDREVAIPDDIREQLKALVGPGTSPVDTVVRGAEIIYARREEMAPEALALAAGLAVLAEQFNFHGLAKENRGTRMALAMMRDGKVKKPSMIEFPDKEKDPEINAEYVRPTATELPVDINTPSSVPVEDTPAAAGARRGRGQRDPDAVNTK